MYCILSSEGTSRVRLLTTNFSQVYQIYRHDNLLEQVAAPVLSLVGSLDLWIAHSEYKWFLRAPIQIVKVQGNTPIGVLFQGDLMSCKAIHLERCLDIMMGCPLGDVLLR